jgi:hypothetical protein
MHIHTHKGIDWFGALRYVLYIFVTQGLVIISDGTKRSLAEVPNTEALATTCTDFINCKTYFIFL